MMVERPGLVRITSRMAHAAIRGAWSKSNGEQVLRRTMGAWPHYRLMRLSGEHAARVHMLVQPRLLTPLDQVCQRYIEANFNA